MELRTTPQRFDRRDADLFPALERSRLTCGCPDVYSITVMRARVILNIDGFHVAPDVQEHLRQLYEQYARWWLHTSGLHPPCRVMRSGFQDCAAIVVHRDHAAWWIDLFNESAAFTYNPWQCFT